MKSRTALGSLLCVTALAACAHSGPRASAGSTTETRSVAAFTKIALRGAADVVVHEGREVRVTATTEGASPDAVVTRVENGTLVIDTRDDCSAFCFDVDKPSPRVVVEVPRLDAVAIEGPAT
jgi:hypothetical protein